MMYFVYINPLTNHSQPNCMLYNLQNIKTQWHHGFNSFPIKNRPDHSTATPIFCTTCTRRIIIIIIIERVVSRPPLLVLDPIILIWNYHQCSQSIVTLFTAVSFSPFRIYTYAKGRNGTNCNPFAKHGRTIFESSCECTMWVCFGIHSSNV